MSTRSLNSGRKLFLMKVTFKCLRWVPPSFDPRHHLIDLIPGSVPTVKYSESVMIWECFSCEMGMPKAGFYFLPKKTKSEWQNLNKKYWRSIRWTCFILMAVKCLCRIMLPAIKSKKVKNYLKQKRIKMLEWPGNCPDLSRMENSWQKIRYLVKQKRTPNMDTLKNQLKKV